MNQPWGDLIEAIDLEWVDPIAGAAPLGATVDTALTGDEPDAIRDWAERSPVEIADWWAALR